MDREKYFNCNIKKHQQAYEALQSLYNRYSVLRVSIFLTMLILVIYLANRQDIYGILAVLGVFLVVFVFVVKRHQRIGFQRDHASHLAQINQEELLRASGELHSFEDGEAFLSAEHPYAVDLDIFGQNSLFQLLSRCTTDLGKRRLAQWLLAPASAPEIPSRQDAIKELASEPERMQELQALGMHFKDNKDNTLPLRHWLKEQDAELDKTYLGVAAYALPLVTFSLLGLSIFTGMTIYPFLGAIAASAILLKQVFSLSLETSKKTEAGIKNIKRLVLLIGQVEASDFKAERLCAIQSHFLHQGYSAATEIRKLQKILDYLLSRANFFYVIINTLLLIDIHLLKAAQRWKRRNRPWVEQWFDAIADLEALNSLAGFHFANPDYAFPRITENPYHFKATSLGHPLIPSAERISNDFTLEGKNTIGIITGSNMSGKSTFLRTVGLNAVLALSGAPTCAQRLEISVMQVFTSMRTQDNLEEHISSFYAELKRIRQLLDRLARGEKVMFMLDEILKGTNSKDRHRGAEALIKQLSKPNCTGLISTHDIELGELTHTLPNVVNYSFNSKIAGEEIKFDYKLEPGICYSFNASKLMQKIGIEL